MQDFEKIIQRLYEKLGIIKDSEFCKKFNITPSTVSSWRNRNSIPYEKIIEITQNANLSLDYVLNGKEIKEYETKNHKKEILEILENSSNKEIECFYHLIKAEIIKKDL